MTVLKNKNLTTLILDYNYIKDGKDVKTTQKFNKVKLDSNEAGIYSVGNAMKEVIKTPSTQILLQEISELYEE